jgi:hypothetical protein
LQAILTTAQPDDIARAGITMRLRQMLDAWQGAEVTPVADAVADRIESASASEIFDFIDNELGRLSDR